MRFPLEACLHLRALAGDKEDGSDACAELCSSDTRDVLATAQLRGFKCHARKQQATRKRVASRTVTCVASIAIP